MTVLDYMLLHALRIAAPILFFAAGTQAAETPVISLSMHYTHAHERMIKAGYRPFRVIPPDSEVFKRNFAFREDIPKKFPEAAQCAPTGKSACNFVFKRGPDEIVEITTVGEHSETLLVRHVRALTLKEADGLYGE